MCLQNGMLAAKMPFYTLSSVFVRKGLFHLKRRVGRQHAVLDGTVLF
jgi:hypothetical protein